ncbi:RNA-directed DNA polymerase, partial [Salmonella enterica subsp. enterica serovar Oranienburg]|nr:RNA-directed DNA polymerase [Salmonella enterica subsp. enterica serovar Typhimurium]EDP2099298.1 RNA-directed DNA polymerase [Salmonella enterica subsp. enterica serovar Oranienburg]
GKLSTDECNKLVGLLAFAKNIEPSFYKSMVIKYGSDNIYKLQKQKDK